MRTMITALVTLMLMTQGGQILAQTNPRPGAVYIQAAARLDIMMTQRGVTITDMSFPCGTVVSVRAVGQQPKSAGPNRFEFHGDVELRAMPPGSLPAGSEPGSAAALLAQAPMVLSAQGVDVVVENVQQ